MESLTGLRWFAALAIFLAHVNVFLPLPYTHGLFGLGVSGVTFFFVLSGFVLTWTMTPNDTTGYFLGRRFARVWPLLFLAIALPTLFAVTGNSADIDVPTFVLVGLASVVLIQAWVPGWILTGPSPVTWSLSCEAFFYVLFPLVAPAIVRRGLRQLLYLAIGLVALGWLIRVAVWIADPPTTAVSSADISSSSLSVLGTYAPPFRLVEFLLGVVVAAALRKGWRSPLRVWQAAALLAAGFLVLWLFRDAAWRSSVPYDAVNQVTAPLFALLIAAVATRDEDGKRSLLSSAPLVRLGRWSYAFYLFHFTVLVAVSSSVFPDKKVVDFFLDPVEPSWSHAGPAAIALLVSLALSALLYRIYEAPLERVLRRFFRRAAGRDDPAPPRPARS
ncbi:acyltransferase [Paractinoplanes ferrugineus]|uniref:Acyltransferase n=1 Tax=Paractinoplanes ferrugineus TaxID=113564 RepID=A0A919J9H0_9ACTN|nr:acyltransferase [Actinoplanes ferrugineus]GIE16220.1 acyltransferase [Actinoplanes ferrugineus]